MTEVISTFFVDSRFRNDGSNVDFYVDLMGDGNMLINYKNVSKVELVGVSLKNVYANDNEEHYFILDIKELNDSKIFSNNPYAHHKFACVYFDHCCPGSNNVTIKPMKGRDFFSKETQFDPPISILNRLTIKLINPATGELLPDQGYVTLAFNITLKKSIH